MHATDAGTRSCLVAEDVGSMVCNAKAEVRLLLPRLPQLMLVQDYCHIVWTVVCVCVGGGGVPDL